MKLRAFRLVVYPAIALAAPAAAVPGGQIGTLVKGQYACELPSDADGPLRNRVPTSDFTIVSASSYRAEGRMGSYLLTGDELILTNGPFKGRRFHRISRATLVETGRNANETGLRCILARTNNS